MISHEEIWRSYFAQAHPGSFRIFVHCADEASFCYGDALAALPGVARVPTVQTAYCDDLVTAMARLLQSALEPTSMPGAPEKFIFVSDTTLPAKPFAEAHRALFEDPDASDICVHPSAHWGTALVDDVRLRLVKTSQWVTLSRAHAEAFVEAWSRPVDPSEVRARGFAGSWPVPLRGGGWDGKEDRSMVVGTFERDFKAGVCSDEWAWFAKIFGAFEPGEAGSRPFPGFGALQDNSAEAQGRCDTFVFQGKHRNWQGPLAEPILVAAAEDPDESRDRAVGVFGDPGFEARGSHPISFTSLGNRTLEAIRASSFLFARRFPEGSQLPYYEDIVLKPHGTSPRTSA